MERGARRRKTRGQALTEFALVYGLVLLPLTFMFVFACQLLWAWHSAAQWTRAGAKYAATHCFQTDGGNVRQWMREHVPATIDRGRFEQGEVEIAVEYFSADPATGELIPFECQAAECTPECVPDRKSTRLNSSHIQKSRMPSSA